MSTYQYRCARHGHTDVPLPFGSATPTRACPTCGAEMARVYTAPMLGLAARGVVAAIDATRASAESPAVVTGLPGAGRRRTPTAPANPALRRLPRP